MFKRAPLTRRVSDDTPGAENSARDQYNVMTESEDGDGLTYREKQRGYSAGFVSVGYAHGRYGAKLARRHRGGRSIMPYTPNVAEYHCLSLAFSGRPHDIPM